jgi:hypothetical protein
MDIFIWKSCGSCKDFNETSLLQMWVSWDECILLGTYKIMLMILLSHICQFSNLIAYQFLNKLTCTILMKLQIYLFLLVSLFVILVAFIKASQPSSFSCWYLWCLWHVYGWISSIYNKINWAFGHALKAKKNSFVYCMTLFWISCSILSIYLVCTCFFVIIIFVMVST